MGNFRPSTLVLHDYGGSPQNREGVFNPYHALVFPDGSIKYRNPNDPYGQPAPHAFRMNPESIGLSYAGQVGSKPTPAAMETLRNEAQKIGGMFPGIRPMGHGEAFQATRGTNKQASRDGRDLVEASWRSNVVYGPPAPGETQVAAGPVPVSDRSLTAFAGLTPKAQPNQRMSLGGPMPAKQQQTDSPSWWGDINSRLQNPLFLGGLGMLVAANQGQDAASALNSGLRTGAGLQDQMMQNSERQRERAKQQALEDFWNSYDPSQLPAGVAGVLPGLSPSQKAELVLQNATGQLPTAEDAALKRAKVKAETEKLQREASGANKYGRQGSIFQDPKTGQFFSVQFSETGERLIEPLQGLTPSRGVGEVDTGTGTQIIDKATGMPVREVGKNLSSAEEQKAVGKDRGETIAGLPQAKLRLDMVTDGLSRLKAQVEAVRDAPGLPKVAGGLYQTYMPNTSGPALNAQTNLENLKTQVSGVVLQSMRDMSKTGGAVGQVTEREWPRLENMIANLDTRQELPEFKRNLKVVLDYADNVMGQLRAAYEADVAKANSGGGAPVQPAPGAARPQSKADYDALPSGTLYVAPDGSMRTKP